MYSVQPMGYMGYPQEPAYSANNTTKKIQNYTFKLNEVLGKGNFSKVYRGLNEITNQPVAIKVVELSSIKTPALVDLLYSEIDIVKALNHPNILRCYEVFSSSNNCYIITELCDGNLETRIKSKGAMPERQACKAIYEVFQGLKYLADQNIVHRDFKIANILLAKGAVKIADFGFAKRTRERFKDINIGSPIYMSPEAFIDHIYGPKTDVWAFGVFIFEILHGDTPLGFCQSEPELKMHIRTPIRVEAINPRISYELKELILRCLDIDERRRISIQEIEQMPFMRRLTAQFGYQSSPPPQQPIQNIPRPVTPNGHMRPPDSARMRIMQPPMPRNQQQYSTSPGRFDNSRKIVLDDESQYRKIPAYDTMQEQQYYNNNRQEEKQEIQQPRFGVEEEQVIPRPNSARSFKILNPSSMLSFHQCVNLLHYCRLVYKTVTQLSKIERFLPAEFKDILTGWLFDVFRQIEDNISTNVKFEGEKAAARQQKLQEVIGEYHRKYTQELTVLPNLQTNIAVVQQNIVVLAHAIDDILQGVLQGNVNERRDLIMAFHYLMYLYETNILLEKCMKRGDYTTFYKKCSIQTFLSTKRDNFDQNSYMGLRTKLEKMS